MSVIMMILKYVAWVLLMVLVFSVFAVIISLAVLLDSPYPSSEIPPLWYTTGLYVCVCLSILWCLIILVLFINTDLEVQNTKPTEQ